MDALEKHRRSLRLSNYDYNRSGAYFVTLCTLDRACLFGHIDMDAMHLSSIGESVLASWLWLATQYPYVSLDSFVIMPNHLHGILFIGSTEGGSRTAPTKIKSLGRLIGAFKTVSTKSINALNGTSTALWQRNYYEHVIRNETDLSRIREYIQNNPAQWALDKENPIFRMGGS